MSDIGQLVPTLTGLPRHEYAEIIRQVDSQRRQAAEQIARQTRPRNGMTRDEFAAWIARQHFAVDKGLRAIAYLPTGAPDDEVRLLEVNELAHLPEEGAVEAVDFMPDVEGVSFSLMVADVTPRQYDAIRAGNLALPDGWRWEGLREFGADLP